MYKNILKNIFIVSLLVFISKFAMADKYKTNLMTFDSLDSNSDGQIVLSEFEAKDIARFNTIDIDSDGILSKAEIAASVSLKI